MVPLVLASGGTRTNRQHGVLWNESYVYIDGYKRYMLESRSYKSRARGTWLLRSLRIDYVFKKLERLKLHAYPKEATAAEK